MSDAMSTPRIKGNELHLADGRKIDLSGMRKLEVRKGFTITCNRCGSHHVETRATMLERVCLECPDCGQEETA